MPHVRKFDHTEARRRYRAGESGPALAREYGVTPQAIYFAVSARVRAAQSASQWKRLRSVCSDCGQPCSFNRYIQERPRCRACFVIAQTTNVRDDALRCGTCREWKWDTAFPYSRAKRCEHRRGRHAQCRECCTKLRRAYRERNKVPCSHGCGTMVLHENGGKAPECHPCAVARINSRLRERLAA
jgi:hypothetical protein